MLSLHEAAAELGVHYMTAYRYVRQGQLGAQRSASGWRVPRSAIDAFRSGAHEPAARGLAGRASRSAPWSKRLEARLIVGDVSGAWGVVESALAAGSTVEQVYTDHIATAMASIGSRWAAGELEVADEHRATVVVQRLLGRLGPQMSRPGRPRGTVIVGAPHGEHHSIPSAVVADLIRADGWNVIDLGADSPPASFLRVIGEFDAVAIVLSVSNASCLSAADEVCEVVLDRYPDMTTIVGGRALDDGRASSLAHVSHLVREVPELLRVLSDGRATSRTA